MRKGNPPALINPNRFILPNPIVICTTMYRDNHSQHNVEGLVSVQLIDASGNLMPKNSLEGKTAQVLWKGSSRFQLKAKVSSANRTFALRFEIQWTDAQEKRHVQTVESRPFRIVSRWKKK